MDKHLNFARNLHIATEVIDSDRVAEAVVEFARSKSITQIYVSNSYQQPWHAIGSRSVPQQIVRLARDMRVVIVSDRS